MKLSMKERIILLIFLFTVILTLGAYLVILPNIQSIEQLKAQLASIESEKNKLIQTVQKLETIDLENLELFTECLTLSSNFYDNLADYESDMLIRSFINENNISTDSLSISSFSVNQIGIEYSHADNKSGTILQPAEEQAELPENINASVGNISVTFQYSGTLENVRKFLDYINDYPRATYISSITIPMTLNEEDENNDLYSGSVVVNFYCISQKGVMDLLPEDFFDQGENEDNAA